MNRYMPLIYVLLLSSSVVLADDEANDREPERKFILEIDNASHAVSLGSRFDLVIAGKRHRARLQSMPVRLFNKTGVSFDFDSKKHFSYEALSPLVDHWSLDGNSSVIMVQNYKSKVADSEIMKAFEHQYNAMKAKLTKGKVKLSYGGKSMEGEKLLITMGNIKLEQQIFFFNGKDRSRVLIIQDTLNDNSGNTEEFLETRKLIQKSLSVN